MGRTEQMSVMENDESTPPLIGYVVLETLDFVVDPKANRVIPNPAHEGKWMADLYIEHGGRLTRPDGRRGGAYETVLERASQDLLKV